MLHSSLSNVISCCRMTTYWLDEHLEMEVLEISFKFDEEDGEIPFYMLNAIHDKGHWGL